MIMSSTHSKYSPSQLARIIKCPGSVQLCREVPARPTSSYAAEGTLLHTYVENFLRDPNWTHAQNNYEKPEYEEVIQSVLDYVEQELGENTEMHYYVVEQKVCIPSTKYKDQIFGTLDFGVVTQDAIHIFDWKFGRGVVVNAKDNEQFLAYASGFLEFLNYNFNDKPEILKAIMEFPIFVHAVQPRIDNFQKEQVTRAEIREFIIRTEKAIALANSPHPPYNPGEEQCRWCAGAGVCNYRISQAQLDLQLVFVGMSDITDNKCSMEKIVELYEKAKDVEAAIKSIERHMFMSLAKGDKVPGYKLVEGRSNRKWLANVDADKLSKTIGVDLSELIEEPKIKSVAQIEKLLPKKERSILEDFYYRPPGNVTLALESSNKEAVIGTLSPEALFKGLGDENDD